MSRWYLMALIAAAATAAVLRAPSPAVSEPSSAAPARSRAAPSPADAGAGPADATAPRGQHWRVRTRRGPVHVWTPEGYEPATAGTVVYVHGYYDNVDQAWRDHGLAAQFAASGRNALFIVPEAPVRHRHKVRWRDLGALIRAVRQHLGLVKPWGPVVAVGHSGAYRTLVPWLEHPPLEHVILLDGLYGNERAFAGWLDEAGSHRLTLVGIDTLRWSEPWTRQLEYTHALDWVPDRGSDLSTQAMNAKLLYMRSQYDHMDIVTQGRVLPALLQATRLPALPAARP